jgi:hypothetical protein
MKMKFTQLLTMKLNEHKQKLQNKVLALRKEQMETRSRARLAEINKEIEAVKLELKAVEEEYEAAQTRLDVIFNRWLGDRR